jgi:membrane-bound lytic murein transglycosylase B
MARLILFILSLSLMVSCASAQQQASVPPPPDYRTWLLNLEQDAIAQGISPSVVHQALDNQQPDERVVAFDQKQPEKTITFDHYEHHIASPDRIRKGRELIDSNSDELQAISQRYGVPPQVIVALWGIESSFGQNSGNYNIVNSLLTLAYEGRRADFFRGELFAALKILERYNWTADALEGSWAGAMGQCQFMPSTYLNHAVSASGSGRPDIWNDERDVWASIANYLASEGWSPDLTWGREVEVTEDLPDHTVGLDTQHSLAEWSTMGVVDVSGKPLPARDLNASLIQPDGADGRSFLVYDNFRALMRWNRSTYFATTVGIMADRMKE